MFLGRTADLELSLFARFILGSMTDRPKLKAVLRPVHVGALALGCIIGFACFVLSGDLLATAGPIGASSGVAIGGLAMLVIARSYGAMVRLFPVAGAEFAYAYHIAGRHHAFLCGWFLILGYLSVIPLNATALGVLGRFLAPEVFSRGYLYSVAGFGVYAGEVMLASAAIVIVGWVHYRGVRQVGGLQVLLTGLLVIGVVVIGVGTSFAPATSFSNWQPMFAPDRSPIEAVLAIVAITPFLYVGFDTLPQAAEEFKFSPGRGLALMTLSIAAGAAMYVTVILATSSVIPWRELVESHQIWATGTTVRMSLGSVGLSCLTVAVVAAVATGINGFYMATSRLVFSMARARLLPNWFAYVHPVHSTPTHAIVFTAALSLLAPWFGRQVLSWVVDMSAVGTALGYTYTCVAAYVVARSGLVQVATWDRRLFIVGAGLALGCLLLLCVPGMPAFMATPSWIALGIWVVLGFTFWCVQARRYSSISAETLDRLILGRARPRENA